MFKVGDKVVCVDNECSLLTLGRTYTVAKVNESHIYLSEIDLDGGYYHFRFKLESDIDPLVEIRQSEYDEMVEEINLLCELLAEANHKSNKVLPEEEDFKPIAEYTMSDWRQALEEDWVFKLRNNHVAKVISLEYDDTSFPVRTQWEWLRLDGYAFAGVKSDYDIVERIK